MIRNTGKPVAPWLALTVIIAFNAAVFLSGTLIGRAFVWARFDQTPPEERQYQAALEKVQNNPNNADNRVDLGWALFQKGMYNEALAEYKKALDLNENHYKALYNLGLAYARVGKHERAISAFQRAIETVPKAFQPHFDLGKVLASQGKYEEAAGEFEIAYRLNPGAVDIIFELGQVYEKMERTEEARFQYESALKFDPKYQPATEALSRLARTGEVQ